jgi:hypothetical protein
MKKLCIIACLSLGLSVATYAQHPVNSFFDDLGTANIHTEDLVTCLDANGHFRNDTIVKTFHRLDDVVWAKYVYSIIDLRYRQNYQLYFPTNITDTDYRNLFKVMVDAISEGLPVYDKVIGTQTVKPLKPDFTKPRSKRDVVTVFLPDPTTVMTPDGELPECFSNPTCTDYSIFQYDSINDALTFQSYFYENFAKNMYKYLIQEIVFFDKHTSRLHRKILAIAPLHPSKFPPQLVKDWANAGMAEEEVAEETIGEDVLAALPGMEENLDEYPEEAAPVSTAMPSSGSQVMNALYESVLFWIPFDALRPYLANQYIIPMQNEVKRVTFDEFFQKHLYASYIVGDGNMYNKNILDFQTRQGQDMTEEEVKKEQNRIQTEMLNFEQDLWEY